MSTKKVWQKKLVVGRDADGCTVSIEVELTLKRKEYSGQRTTHLKPVPDYYTTLSISGEGMLPDKSYCAYWGQIQDTIRSELDTMELAIDRDKLLRILEIWDKFHLSDVTAGTEKQEKAIEDYYAKNKRRYRYEDACEMLKRAKLYEDRGYKYGHAWLLRILPKKIVKEVRSW